MSIAIIDYGMGNLGSVRNAFAWLGIPAQVTADPESLRDATAVVFPGQGAWGDCMRNLQRLGFVDPLKEWIAQDRPFLGICMGLQLLFETSEESPGMPGLGVFKGEIRRFVGSDLKIPQMGWNTVRHPEDCPLFDGIPDASHFYFVHSYKAPVLEGGLSIGLTDYGGVYTSALRRGSLYAVQFHPEKSQQNGLRLLTNFAATVGVKAVVS